MVEDLASRCSEDTGGLGLLGGVCMCVNCFCWKVVCGSCTVSFLQVPWRQFLSTFSQRVLLFYVTLFALHTRQQYFSYSTVTASRDCWSSVCKLFCIFHNIAYLTVKSDASFFSFAPSVLGFCPLQVLAVAYRFFSHSHSIHSRFSASSCPIWFSFLWGIGIVKVCVWPNSFFC